ncbi:endonuclease/exonuclease/phosphatase family protein [Fertoebacter nigrum]|uniref:Endonuclease/exonuclease/phosphatase family protein n=1 Tax=Fertoeibacter niger TaxID=2656921 RepID=A0A8X8KMG9_9RHOB|nr:endonuclease/exonuclease/phosphatase family protein [Fertoeibacter niger]NUB46369.1 endonuclease/exonuclease/phosphatase family protein [Fertoeibacter niger]
MALADTLRIATYTTELARRGPGLLLRDIRRGDDPQVLAVLAMIKAVDADAILLTGIDYDHDLLALHALADALASGGQDYPHRFALRPNTGMATGLDMDGDGRRGGARDAQGYGRFAGAGGMALLSRLPVDLAALQDYSGLLWRDLPGADLPAEMAADVRAVQRLSTTAHWEVPLILPDGSRLRLLAWHATPPVFDGPEDRNGRRNHDEAAFWLRLLGGQMAQPPPAPPFVLLGNANLDLHAGQGRTAAMASLLAHPALRDPLPQGADGPATADYSARDGPGKLRVDYVLPSVDLRITAAGVLRPAPGTALAATASTASRHAPVWADIVIP